MSGDAALAATLARDGAVWRKRLRVPDRETIRGTDHRSTSNQVCGIDQHLAVRSTDRAYTPTRPRRLGLPFGGGGS